MSSSYQEAQVYDAIRGEQSRTSTIVLPATPQQQNPIRWAFSCMRLVRLAVRIRFAHQQHYKCMIPA